MPLFPRRPVARVLSVGLLLCHPPLPEQLLSPSGEGWAPVVRSNVVF